MKRNCNRLLWSFCIGVGIATSVHAVVRAPSTATPAPLRVIVKLTAPLAASVEAALPLESLELITSPNFSASDHAQQFLLRNHLKRLRPLYGEIMRRKKRSGKSAQALAQETRESFPQRARRFNRPFNPPDLTRTYLIDGFASQSELDDVLRSLQNDPDVESAAQDGVVTVELTPNDPYWSTRGSWGQAYDDLWGLKDIEADKAWNFGAGAGVIVAVVDTGVDYTHPDIAANLWTDGQGNYGYNFVTNTTNPMDGFGHGTHVAGTIAAVGNNGLGVIGVAYQARVMAVKVLDDVDGTGAYSAIVQGITWAADHGAQVMNLSFGGPSDPGNVMEDAIQYAYQMGVVIVAAAGNNAADLGIQPLYPAIYPQVITVSASDWNDQLAYFSNYGTKIDVGAPGLDVLSLKPLGTCNLCLMEPASAILGNYMHISGTSMATPHVAGLAALILSQNSGYTNEQVRQAIRQSADTVDGSGFTEAFGYGRINAGRALDAFAPLTVTLTSPAQGAVFSSPISVTGSAIGSNFASYTLDYAPAQADTSSNPPSGVAQWTTFVQSNQPVANGTLGVLDPSTIPQGNYWVRLSVTDSAGVIYRSMVSIVVQFSAITQPAPPSATYFAVTSGTSIPIQIQGTAGGSGFQSYTLSWAEGVSPTAGWSTTGITLTGGGQQAIAGGALGVWDPSSLTVGDFYTIRLLVNFAGHTAESDSLVFLDPQMAPGWPQPGSTYELDSNLLASPDAGGGIDLYEKGLYFLHYGLNGSIQALAAWNVGVDLAIRPPMFDFGGLGRVAAIPFLQSESPNQITAAVIGANGSQVSFSGLPIYIVATQAADVDGDGIPELLIAGNASRNFAGIVYAFKPDGSQAAGFPIQLSGDSIVSEMDHPLLTAPVSGHSGQDLFIFGYHAIHHYSSKGVYLEDIGPNYSSQTPGAAMLVSFDQTSPPSIVFGVTDYTNNILYAIGLDGTPRPGWPVTTPGDGWFELAAGNLTPGGPVSIVGRGVNGNVHSIQVFSAGGVLLPGWPQYGASLVEKFSCLRLADVDGDGSPEILVGSSVSPSSTASQVFVKGFHADGSLYKSWPLTLGGRTSNGTPAEPYDVGDILLGDFDGDGKTDMAVEWAINNIPFTALPFSSNVALYHLNVPYSVSSVPWPMRYHDPQNSDFFQLPPLQSVPTLQPFPPTISPNGANFSSSISVALTDLSHDASIYYTLDGSSPSSNSAFYIGPFTLTQGATVNAVALGAGMAPSVIASANFTAAPEAHFILGETLSRPRNNFSGWVGMQFSVGPQALSVSALGRLTLSGNTQPHTVKLVDAESGQDIPGGGVSVTSGAPGLFGYASLPSAVTLAANTTYYLVSHEEEGGDRWYDASPVTSSSDGAIAAAIFAGDSAPASWAALSLRGHSYGPVDFVYQVGNNASALPAPVLNRPIPITRGSNTTAAGGGLMPASTAKARP